MYRLTRPRLTLSFMTLILHCSCGSTDHEQQRTQGSTTVPSESTVNQNSDVSVPDTPSTPSDTSNTPPATADEPALCPAPQALTNELVLFDDTFHQSWDGTTYGGPSSRLARDGETCSGTAAFALEHVTQKYTGSVLYTSGASTRVSHVSMRIYVDAPGTYTLGINFAGQQQGSHNFLYPPQSNSSFIRTFQTGWQLVEGDVPDSFNGTTTGALTAIILEMQSDSNINQFRIDDVRVTRRP